MCSLRRYRLLLGVVLALTIAGGIALADVFTNPGIPGLEKSNLSLVYEFPIPVTSGGWNSAAVPYTVNNAGTVPAGSFDRVAYYLELEKPDTSLDWVYASFDAAGFTNDAGKTGVPNTASGEYYNFTNTSISNMNVYSNVAGVTTGTGIGTGNVEFWPSNYGTGNSFGVPGASDGVFDFGDGGSNTGAGHGTMQVHNYGAGQTLFAYNAWGSVRTSELGIGNQPGGNPDWTFNTSNISNYTARTLQILVGIPPELTWDGTVNDWGTAHWLGAPPTYPDATAKATINGGIVTVEADHAANALTMTGGQLVVGPGNTLTVIGNLDATGGAVSMGASAALSVGGGSLSDYSDGGSAANLVKTGGNTLTLDNSAGGISAAGTTIQVDQGTLRGVGTSPLGGAAEVVLNGGTLALQGANMGLADGLRGSIFFSTPDNETPMNLDGANYQHAGGRIFTGDKSGTVLALAEDPDLNVVVAGSTQNWTAWSGKFDGNADHFITAYSGRFFPQADGDYNFHWNNDDRGLMFIDMNDDGVFDNSERVAGYAWNSNGNVTLSTAQGGYNVIYMAQEFGGGQGVDWRFTPPGGSEALVNPGSQAGMWKYEQIGAVDASGTNITVTADSALQANTDVSATLGALTLNDGTSLSTSGAPMTFLSTSISGPAGRSGAINNSNQIGIGSYNDGGVASTLIKRGGGGMMADNTTPGNIVGGSTNFRLEGGTLTATGTAANGSDLLGGPAAITLAGGTLQLQAPTGMPGGLQTWYEASTLHYADGDPVTTWSDASGNGHTASLTGGSMTFATDEINGLPVVRFADSTYANAVGNMYAKEQYVVVKVDSGDWGAFLGSQVRSGYLLNQNGNFWGSNMPDAVSKDGTALASPYSLGDNQPFMLLKITGNDSITGPRAYALGRQEGWGRLAMDLAEILAFDHALTPGEENQIGGYLAAKYGISAPNYTGSLNLQPLDMSGTAVRVEGDSTLRAVAAPSGSFGPLTMQTGTLSIEGMPGGVTFAGGGVDAGASGFGLNNSMDVTINGPYDGNHAAGTLTKTGAGALTFTQGTTNHEGVSVEVRQGRLVAGGAMQAANLNLYGTASADTGTNDVTISDGGRLLAGNLKISGSGASFRVGGDDLASGPERMGLSGGTVTVRNGGSMPDGLQLWLDAETLTGLNNGDPVTTWADQSGFGRDAGHAQGNPTYVASGPNGQPVINFLGSTNSRLYTDYNFDALTEHSILTVARYTGGDSERVIASMDHNWLFGFHGNNDGRYYAEGWIANSGSGTTTWHLHAGTINDDPDPLASFWRDGTQLAADNNGSNNTNYRPGRLALGGWSGSEFSNSEIAEVLIFDHVLTASELNNVGGYLNAKYGFGIPSYTGGFEANAIDLPDTAVTVTATTTLLADTLSTATFGDLTVPGGTTLTLSGAPGGFSFADVGGAGTIDGSLTARTGLVPGDSAGTLTVTGDLTVADGVVYEWELGLPDSDLIDVSGTLSLGDWTLSIADDGGSARAWDKLYLFTGPNVNPSANPLLPGNWSIDPNIPVRFLEFTNPADLWIDVDDQGIYLTGLATVPEPASLGLLALGAFLLAPCVRRRKR